VVTGMSYRKGIFFFNSGKGIGHAAWQAGRVQTHFFPWGVKGLLFLFSRVALTLPAWVYAAGALLVLLNDPPAWLIANWPEGVWRPEVPLYLFILCALGYHFVFPRQQKLFHGAEHKVFSFSGDVNLRQVERIANADIVNRNCSTNSVVLYYLVFGAAWPFLGGWIATGLAVLALLTVPRWWKWADGRVVFPLSARLQRRVTCARPEPRHLRVAVLSYMSFRTGRALDEDDLLASMAEEDRQREEAARREQEDRQRDEARREAAAQRRAAAWQKHRLLVRQRTRWQKRPGGRREK
jgi:hypothetical protein